MPVYIIVEVSIHDEKIYEEYKKLTPASIEAFHGRFIIRGGQTTALEGNWKPERIVVVEFPTIELANTWYNSEIYAPAKELRQRAASTRMILANGI